MEFAQLSQLFHVLHSIDPAQPVNWTLIAHQAGFYDQAHFNKDFLALTGYSSTNCLRLYRRFSIQDPQQGQSLGQMPID